MTKSSHSTTSLRAKLHNRNKNIQKEFTLYAQQHIHQHVTQQGRVWTVQSKWWQLICFIILTFSYFTSLYNRKYFQYHAWPETEIERGSLWGARRRRTIRNFIHIRVLKKREKEPEWKEEFFSCCKTFSLTFHLLLSFVYKQYAQFSQERNCSPTLSCTLFH